MVTIPEINDQLNKINLEKRRIEDVLSSRMTTIIEKEIQSINEEYGASPKSIEVEFINSRSVGSFCDTYILREVRVKI